jgi:hypothetical protein
MNYSTATSLLDTLKDERDQSRFSRAFFQLMDEPITYNIGIAQRLGIKDAIILDALKAESFYDNTDGLVPSIKLIAARLGLTERLVRARVKHLISLGHVRDDLSVTPYLMQSLDIGFDTATAFAINRLHFRCLLAHGASISSVVLMTVLLSMVQDGVRMSVTDDDYSWMVVNDEAWMSMTALSIKELRNAKKVLLELGLLLRIRVGIPAQYYVALELNKLSAITLEFANASDVVEQTDDFIA